MTADGVFDGRTLEDLWICPIGAGSKRNLPPRELRRLEVGGRHDRIRRTVNGRGIRRDLAFLQDLLTKLG
jgi:hypothetical protein